MVSMMQEQPTESVVVQTLFEMAGITKEMVLKEYHAAVDEAVKQAIILWDIEAIEKATTYKKSFLEEHLLCDPRIRQYERQRGPRSKRVWLREPTAKMIEHIIMNEWN